MAGRENYYLILGLFDFDDDLVGKSDGDTIVKGKIDEAVKQKKAEWAKGQNDPKMGSRYKQYIEALPAIEKELATQAGRRAEHADARKRKEQEIRKTLHFGLDKGFLYEKEVENYARKLGLPGEVLKRFIKVDIKPSAQAVPEAPAGKELLRPAFSSKFSNADKLLPADSTNLYEFLNEGKDAASAMNMSAARWKSLAEDMRRSLPDYAREEISNKRKLCEHCITEAFASEQSKQQYDEYLSWKRLQEILGRVAEQFIFQESRLARQQVESFVDELHAACGNRKDANGYFVWWCSKRAIDWERPDAKQEEQKALCPFCHRQVQPGDKKCPHCGEALVAICPKCKKDNAASNQFCSHCGLDFGSLKKAAALCAMAKTEMDVLNLEVAKSMLDEAEALWPGLGQLSPLRAEWTRLQQSLGPAAGKMRRHMKAGEFWAANEELGKIRARFPQYKDPALEQALKTALAAAAKALAEAKAAKDAAKAEEWLLKAYSACADYPEVVRLLAKNPPPPVQQVVVLADGKARCNTITWAARGGDGVDYLVVRSEGAAPCDPADGTAVGASRGAALKDTGIQPGIAYHYAVFARRGPVHSPPAVAQNPCVNLFEIGGADVFAAAGEARAQWRGVPAGGRVEVWRAKGHPTAGPGSGEKVASANNQGMRDQGLENDTEYHYRACVVYSLPGGPRRSDGFCFKVVPSEPPAQIGYVNPRLTGENRFTLEWDQPDGANVRFYAATEKPALEQGDLVDLRELEAKLLPVAIESRQRGRGEFTLPEGDVFYFVAASVKNESALVGPMVTLSGKEIVTIRDVQLSGNDLFVKFDWPAGVNRVLLLKRPDRFASSSEDTGASRVIVTRETYEMRRAIELRNCAPGDYYFTLYAELGSRSDATYSAGHNHLFSFGQDCEVVYSLQTAKGLGKRIKSAQLIFESPGGFPKMQVYTLVGARISMRSQGTLLMEIKPPGADVKRFTQSLPPECLSPNTYVKVYLANEDDRKFSVNLKQGASPKLG